MEKEVINLKEIFIKCIGKFELYGFNWKILRKDKIQLSLFDSKNECHLVNIDIPDDLINPILNHIKNYSEKEEVTK